MDKRTRVRRAMDKLPVDHVPVSFWYHFKGEEMLGEPCAQAHVRYVREADVDFVKIMCDSYFAYPLPEIREPSDWYKLRPIGRDAPYIKDQVWRAKRIVELTGGECCAFYTLFAPFSTIRFSAPDELVMEHLREDENAVLYALDVIAQDNALLGNLLENAVEACLRMPPEATKRIRLKTACKPAFWYMVIENTYDGMLAPKEQQGFFTRKNNNEYHGIGLSSAMHLVEKHKGTLDVQPSAELFRVGIMIPIEK